MKTQLPAAINNVTEAKTLLKDLYINSELFHPEDDANDLVGAPFTKTEGDKLNALMQQIYQLSEVPEQFDPCGFVVDLNNTVWVIKYGELYAIGMDFRRGCTFRWSSNVHASWHLNSDDIEWFEKMKKKNRWDLYNIDKIELK